MLRHFTWDPTLAKCYRETWSVQVSPGHKLLDKRLSCLLFLLKTLHSVERHTQVVKISLDDFSAGLSSRRGTGEKSAGSHPRSSDVRLKEKSICTPFFFFFFWMLKSMNTAANLISHTGDTCRACAISDKHMWRWSLDSEMVGQKYIFMKISNSFNTLQMAKQWRAFLCSGFSFFPPKLQRKEDAAR